VITEIGKLKIRWEIDSEEIHKVLKEHYKEYLIARGKVDLHIRIKEKTPPTIRERQIILKTKGWECFKSKGKMYLYFPRGDTATLAEINNPYVNVYTKGRGQLFLYLFPEVLYALILPQYGGLLLHACGVKVDEEILVFMGPPEGGKSTLAKLALKMGFEILNDDRLILRKFNGEFWIFGNPWHGEVNQTFPIGGKIKKVFFLEKAKGNSLQELGKRDTIGKLIKNSFIFRIEKENYQKTLELLLDMSNKVKGYVLKFKPTLDIWEYITKEVVK
jgi:hypothetical protein